MSASVKPVYAVCEGTILSCLARTTFKDALVCADNCTWTGDECDLLVVQRHTLRLIDVEVKISRADLKADRKKDKWLDQTATWSYGQPRPPPVAREWPRRVWKHYYAMPEAIWRDGMIEFCGKTSGILLITPRPSINPRHWSVRCTRRAKPNPEAKPVTNAQLLDVARLTSLRLWDARTELSRLSGGEDSPSVLYQ